MRSRAAVVAVVAFVLIAIAGAAYIVKMTGRSIDETAAVQAGEAPEIARLYIAKYGSLAAAAPTIVRLVSRSGLHVVVIDRKTGTMYGSGRGGRPTRWMHRAGDGAFAPRPGDGGPPPPGATAPGTPPGPPPDHFGPLGEGFGRGDWFAVLIASAAGESARRTRIPDGEIVVFPDPRSILGVFEIVTAGLAVVFAASGFALWLYVRGVRRAALRPLYETTLALQRLAQRDFSPRTIMAGEGSAYDDLARAYNAAVEAVSSAFAERRAAESEMQRFIADAGHELRTPLTIVMGYLDIIAAGALSEPAVAKRITNGMRTEATRMRKLIDKLIILAKMETPSDLDARSNIDVVSLVQRVIESLEPLSTQPIRVAGVPFAHVFANEDDLAEALTNIVENGLKYAPASPIDVRVERAFERVVIAISDHGPGMSTDEKRNAFERFYRGEKRGEISGSGLGLAIAKRAIERSRGTIRLDSAAGAGTTFTIELPEQPIAVTDARPARLAHR
jgi:two-component system OmpR family sensor kinase